MDVILHRIQKLQFLKQNTPGFLYLNNEFCIGDPLCLIYTLSLGSVF